MEDLAGKKLPTVEQVETMIPITAQPALKYWPNVSGSSLPWSRPPWIACASCDGCLKATPFQRLPAIETTVSNPLSAVRAQSTGMCNSQQRKDIECVL